MRNTPSRSIKTSLGIFLLDMKSGLPNKTLTTILNISKSSLRRAILSVRKTLMSSIVPNYLGFEHTTRRLQRPSSCEIHIIYSSYGYVISILRPFFAEMKNKDAAMLNHAMMRNTDTIRQWVQE